MTGNWSGLRLSADAWIERAVEEAREGRFAAARGCYRQAEKAMDAADRARGLKPGPCRLDARVELERLMKRAG